MFLQASRGGSHWCSYVLNHRLVSRVAFVQNNFAAKRKSSLVERLRDRPRHYSYNGTVLGDAFGCRRGEISDPFLPRLLLPRAVAEIIQDAIRDRGSRFGRNAGITRSLPGQEVRHLYRRFNGMKEMIEIVGGLKKFVQMFPHHLKWHSGKVYLKDRRELCDAHHSEAEDSARVTLTPDDVRLALSTMIAASGGSLSRGYVDEQLSERAAVFDVVCTAGGLEAFVDRYCTDLFCTADAVQSGSHLLCELMRDQQGSLTCSALDSLRDKLPTIDDCISFLEPPPSEVELAEIVRQYSRYQKERLVTFTESAQGSASSLDLWYAEACLVCLKHCPLESFSEHSRAARHVQTYMELGQPGLRSDVIRPNPRGDSHAHCSGQYESFLSVSRFATSRVLVLGEADFSFSLRVAAAQQQDSGRSQLVATSYLAEFDPAEPVVNISKSKPVWYRRRSLSSMGGLLGNNLAKLEALGAHVLHSVDATDLENTLVPRCITSEFDVIVFPFPQVSAGSDPRNALLVESVFRGIRKELSAERGILARNGMLQLILLESQYRSWDVACLAIESNFYLAACVPLPSDFYSCRSMVSTRWSPLRANLYVFQEKLPPAES